MPPQQNPLPVRSSRADAHTVAAMDAYDRAFEFRAVGISATPRLRHSVHDLHRAHYGEGAGAKEGGIAGRLP